jgi:branched-chain amino acid transport system ATP-binding protein
MSNPQILMLDEPSLGLSPLLCRELFHTLMEVRQAGLGILLVEQNAKQSLAIADRGYLLENAHIVGEDSAAKLIRDPAVQKAYLGVSAGGHLESGGPRPTAATTGEAEEVASSSDRPAPIKPAGHARVRHSISELIGQNIDELVSHAAEFSASHRSSDAARAIKPELGRPAATSGTTSSLTARYTSSGAFHGDELQRTLSDIEEAASRARQPQRPATQVESKPPAPEPLAALEAKPKVDVWKRPTQIEIYRRTRTRPGKTSGKLVRIKGDDDG